MATLPKDDVRSMYQSGAQSYDLTTILFRFVGLRMGTYRTRAVERMQLRPGDHAVELGCGTGLNFPLLLEKVGPLGHVTGVDLTPGMLDVARAKVEKGGWQNVDLVQADISEYELPESVDAVLATGVFGYVASYDRVIEKASRAIRPGGHLVILDGKQPESLPSWIFRIVLGLGRPFGFTSDYFNVAPWESIERCFEDTHLERMYGGMIYLSSGTVAQNTSEPK